MQNNNEPREWTTWRLHFKENPPQQKDLYALLGELLCCWNNLEGLMRSLLIHVCGYSETSDVLTAELTAEGLSNALRAAAKRASEPAFEKEVEFAANKMNELRVYRNDMIHGACGFGAVDEQNGLKVRNKSAKAVVKIVDQTISAFDIVMMIESINQLAHFAGALNAIQLLKRTDVTSMMPERPLFPVLSKIPRKI